MRPCRVEGHFLRHLRFDLSPGDKAKKDKSIQKCTHLLLSLEYARIPGGCFSVQIAPNVILPSLHSSLLTVHKMQVTLMPLMRKRQEKLKELLLNLLGLAELTQKSGLYLTRELYSISWDKSGWKRRLKKEEGMYVHT